MFAIITSLIGAGFGWVSATRGGGNLNDKLQYAAVSAIIGFLLGLSGTILADWMGWV